MAFDFKNLFKKKDKVAHKPAASAGTRRPIPGIGHLSTEIQFRILGILFLISLLVTIVAIFMQSQASSHGAAYLAVSGKILPITQQIPKAAQNAVEGKVEGFRELRDARARFNQLLEHLNAGGDVEGTIIPATSEQVRPKLEALQSIWKTQDNTVNQIFAQEKALNALGRLAQEALQQGPGLIEGAAQGSERLQLTIERILRSATQLAWAPGFDNSAVTKLNRDLSTAVELAPAGGTMASNLIILSEAFSALPSDIAPLANARTAGERLNKDTQKLAGATNELIAAYEAEAKDQSLSTIGIAIFGSLALVTLVLMGKLFNDDAGRRAEESERQRRIAENEKDSTQGAILRLMNEMGDLADGDLTIRATVTEDITGAIADSVNYTIEELSVLVRRINDAAQRVARASDAAQTTSRDLLSSTEVQSSQIQNANASVLSMAESMKSVSSSALESAHVARASLEAAQKGAAAVSNSISGMNEIRGQIQETSKRIKRLGESSQEIGEIVELISDITEQTNVLALNAAIQAASAGEAGRGFSVVAEEVQRLAERSGEATKQIAAIVKTIQTDTHDAVAAMEHATQDVVEGARLSDAAGQALTEISTVSQDLARLIESISSDTQRQAEIATNVAVSMQDILRITDQTTVSTQETAVSIGELADLAVELKGSVSGFKV